MVNLMTTQTSRPVDPRIERTRNVVLEAASALVGELGYGRVTVEAIAERSGVARSTIYRHWKQLPDLLAAALAASIESDTPPDTGELRTDLVILVSELAEFLTAPRLRSTAMALVTEADRDPAVAEIHAQFLRARQERTASAIQRGIERGELPTSVDGMAMSLDLAAPVFFRALVQHQPVDAAFVEQHVDRWIAIHRTNAD